MKMSISLSLSLSLSLIKTILRVPWRGLAQEGPGSSKEDDEEASIIKTAQNIKKRIMQENVDVDRNEETGTITIARKN